MYMYLRGMHVHVSGDWSCDISTSQVTAADRLSQLQTSSQWGLDHQYLSVQRKFYQNSSALYQFQIHRAGQIWQHWHANKWFPIMELKKKIKVLDGKWRRRSRRFCELITKWAVLRLLIYKYCEVVCSFLQLKVYVQYSAIIKIIVIKYNWHALKLKKFWK